MIKPINIIYLLVMIPFIIPSINGNKNPPHKMTGNITLINKNIEYPNIYDNSNLTMYNSSIYATNRYYYKYNNILNISNSNITCQNSITMKGVTINVFSDSVLTVWFIYIDSCNITIYNNSKLHLNGHNITVHNTSQNNPKI